MILDTLGHAHCSHFLGPRFAAGLKWLADFSSQTADGRYDIQGDDLFVLVQSYPTVPAIQKNVESHRIYADIQSIASGTEVIYYAPIHRLKVVTGYDDCKDIMFYADAVEMTSLVLGLGSFAIFHPHDGHKPGCLASSPSQIKKAVVKVRI